MNSNIVKSKRGEKTLGANYYVTKFIGSDKIEWCKKLF